MNLLIKQAGSVIQTVILFSFLLFTGGCEKALDLKDPNSGSVAVFDEIWSVVDQHYALFSVKGVDWKSVYDQYRVQVSDNMSESDLFKLASNMLATLQDGHISLINKTDTGTYDGFYKGYPANFNFEIIRVNYLKNDFKTTGPLIYKMVEGVGYIYYNSFTQDITDNELDIVFNEMAISKGLIIDVRNNFGGNSMNVDRLARRFLSARTLVKFEKIKSGPGHDDFETPARAYYLDSAPHEYASPVVVLTNRSCFSACNDFVLYMSEQLQVTLMGDQTGGGGGIPHDYILRNGWRLQYTATETLSPQSESIENGIQPNQKISITPQDELSGRDPILEAAFQQLK